LGLIFSIVQIVIVLAAFLILFIGAAQRQQKAVTECQGKVSGSQVSVVPSTYICKDGGSVQLVN
jgi:hypothetical protein